MSLKRHWCWWKYSYAYFSFTRWICTQKESSLVGLVRITGGVRVWTWAAAYISGQLLSHNILGIVCDLIGHFYCATRPNSFTLTQHPFLHIFFPLMIQLIFRPTSLIHYYQALFYSTVMSYTHCLAFLSRMVTPSLSNDVYFFSHTQVPIQKYRSLFVSLSSNLAPRPFSQLSAPWLSHHSHLLSRKDQHYVTNLSLTEGCLIA